MTLTRAIEGLDFKCPHLGFETWRLVQHFYNSLTQMNRNMIESMNGGSFLSLTDRLSQLRDEDFMKLVKT